MMNGSIAKDATTTAPPSKNNGKPKSKSCGSNCSTRLNESRSWRWRPAPGIWTSELLKIGDHITALDASAEMIAINRAKLQSDRVHYQQTDLFSWQPEQEYDMVFFGFWLSHVPTNKLSQFLTVVHRALKKGGRLFLVDSQKPDFSNPQTQTENLGDERQKRVLKDGRQFEIVKIYYQPPKLSATLRQHGFDIEVQTTPDHFLYADGVKLD